MQKSSTETFSPALQIMQNFHAAMVLTPETLMHAIFAQYDFSNVQILDNSQGYTLILSGKQISLKPSIEQMENFGYFSSVTYEEHQITLELNSFGSDLFLKHFIFH